jgi:opacity protein-like surface antigen
MKQLILTITTFFLVCGAHAQFEGSASAGACIIDRNNIEAGDCHQFSLGLGYEITERTTLTLAFNSLDGEMNGLNGAFGISGDYDRSEFILGARYDLALDLGKFQPYVGAGLGYGEISTQFSGYTEIDPMIRIFADGDLTSALWAVRAGGEYPISPTVNLFTEFAYTQYLDNGIDIRFETANGTIGELSPGGVKGEDRSYDFNFGIRIKF